MTKKIVLSVLFLGSIFTMPWYIVVTFALFLISFGAWYWSAPIGVFFFDILHTVPLETVGGVGYVLTILVLGSSLLAYVLRRRLLE